MKIWTLKRIKQAHRGYRMVPGYVTFYIFTFQNFLIYGQRSALHLLFILTCAALTILAYKSSLFHNIVMNILLR
jgi:hypothetical protein